MKNDFFFLFLNRRRSSSSYEGEIDTALDDKLKQSALRNNLSHEDVKKIITVSSKPAFCTNFFSVNGKVTKKLFFF